MKLKNTYRAIGLMSGTSLDGLDIACCVFTRQSNKWSFAIEKAETISYPHTWTARLSGAAQLSSAALLTLHSAYGSFLGEQCLKFIRKNRIKSIDFIASHGHTIFHQPENKFTFQLGDGNALYASSGIPVICDFRSLDVMLGGQGAPLVPVGDHFLFADYDVCLNIGGIANLSFLHKGQRMAFDICFANMGLNYLAQQAGKKYDKDGAMAADGQLHKNMMKHLNAAYSRLRNKRPSLGRELFEQRFKSLLDDESISLHDRLHTFTESVAKEFATALPGAGKKPQSVLCTGGGASNAYLIYRMMHYAGDRVNLVLPDDEIINFKEALVFAFLGVKRIRQEVNCLASVTGAKHDSCSGVLVGFS